MNPIEYEKVLMKYLLVDEKIRDKTIPYISDKIFEDDHVKSIFNTYLKFNEKFGNYPSPREINDLIERKNPKYLESLTEIIKTDVSDTNDSYIFDSLEDFIKRKMVWQDVLDIKEIVDSGEIDNVNTFADSIKDTTGFTFDTSVGVSLKDSFDDYFEHLNNPTVKIPTGVGTIDQLIGGGIRKKAMTLFIAPPNSGKSLAKCSIATNMALSGIKALYVSLEMDEFMVLGRLLCNLFDMPIGMIEKMQKDELKDKYTEYVQVLKENLIIKEFPTKTMNANMLNALLEELGKKQNFKPDVIFVDYLGIMAPNRVRGQGKRHDDLYDVAEELRGIAGKWDCAIVSSQQANRSAIGDIPDMSQIADSMGPAATADLIIGIGQDERLKEDNQYGIKIIKSRSGDNGMEDYVGVDKDKQRIYDLNGLPSQSTLASAMKKFDDKKKKKAVNI